MRKGWAEVALGEVVKPVSRCERVMPDSLYRLLGVRLEGNGAFHRETKLGSEISAGVLDRVEAGDFIYSRLFACRGAFSLISPDLDGAFVSNEFPIFQVRTPARIDLRFLKFWFRQATVWKVVEEDCQGSTPLTRNRYKEEFFNALQIPLPPLAEQQQIVARLDAIESRLTLAQKLREDVALEVEAFTTSQHLAAAKTKVVRLERLLRLDEEQEIIKPDGSYPQVGLRSFGLGMFKKPPVLGSETTYRSFNVLRIGQFVMSQVKGWEGAVAVAGKDYNGWFASPEYRTFSCVEGECDSAYLSHIVSTSWFQKQLLSATRGVGARRERVRPEMLLGLELPFPDFDTQVKAVPILEKQRLGLQLSSQARERANALLPALLDKLFKI